MTRDNATAKRKRGFIPDPIETVSTARAATLHILAELLSRNCHRNREKQNPDKTPQTLKQEQL
ncbi:MAG: hypothetical protein NZ935_12490, partial [Planctomycetes bacterium]|nr:hypothetical protein [Planctomycetota bacterium]